MSNTKRPVDVITFLALMVETSGKNRRQIAREARLKERDFLSQVLRGERELPLDKAAAVARACGEEEAFFVGITLAENHEEIWSILQATPDSLLPYNEREFLKLYWRASPRGRLEITPRRAAAVLEALNDGAGCAK